MIIDRVFGKILYSFGQELFNFESRINALFNEMIPGLSNELLPEWEKDLGLPDACSVNLGAIEERQRAVHTKYTTKYTGLSKSFFIQYAKNIGSTIKVYDLVSTGQPFRVDKNRVDRTPADGIDGARLWSLGVTFVWIVEIQKDDPNRNYLHCRFMQMNPAHLILIWKEVEIL